MARAVIRTVARTATGPAPAVAELATPAAAAPAPILPPPLPPAPATRLVLIIQRRAHGAHSVASVCVRIVEQALPRGTRTVYLVMPERPLYWLVLVGVAAPPADLRMLSPVLASTV